jgi:hypothetical protein
MNGSTPAAYALALARTLFDRETLMNAMVEPFFPDSGHPKFTRPALDQAIVNQIKGRFRNNKKKHVYWSAGRILV